MEEKRLERIFFRFGNSRRRDEKKLRLVVNCDWSCSGCHKFISRGVIFLRACSDAIWSTVARFFHRFASEIYADDLISFRFKSSTRSSDFKRCLCACDGEIMCGDGRRVECQFILRITRIYLLP